MKRNLLFAVLIAALITLGTVTAVNAKTNESEFTTTKRAGSVVALRRSVFKWNFDPDEMVVNNPKTQKTFKNFIGYLIEDNVSLSGKFKDCKIHRQVISLLGGERKVIADDIEKPIPDKATQGVILGGWVTGEPLSDGILDHNEVLIELIQPDGSKIVLWNYQVKVVVKGKEITKTETNL